MPLYEYECECGAILETLESSGLQRFHCGELCKQLTKSTIEPGKGSIQKLFSSPAIRGDGKEAQQPTFSSTGQVKRPYSDCHDCHGDK